MHQVSSETVLKIVLCSCAQMFGASVSWKVPFWEDWLFWSLVPLFTALLFPVAAGEHNGMLNRKQYFTCAKDYGVFVPVHEVICIITRAVSLLAFASCKSPNTSFQTWGTTIPDSLLTSYGCLLAVLKPMLSLSVCWLSLQRSSPCCRPKLECKSTNQDRSKLPKVPLLKKAGKDKTYPSYASGTCLKLVKWVPC